MGVYNAEIFNNIGLCCFYAQQFDMALSCLERALSLASDDNMADVWYNISHVAVVRQKICSCYYTEDLFSFVLLMVKHFPEFLQVFLGTVASSINVSVILPCQFHF